MPFIPRKTSLSRLRERIRKNQPIVGAGAGTGISAKFAERGGVDLIIIYNSGRFRMAGRGSLAGLLPYGDANAIVQDMAKEVLPVVRDTPVLAGVCGTDPFRIIPVFLRELKAMGFDGIQNFPTVGLIDGVLRANLEETGMSYDLEVEMVREARRLGPGEIAHIPKDVVHGTYNAGDTDLVFLAILSPAVFEGPALVDVSGDAPWASLRAPGAANQNA